MSNIYIKKSIAKGIIDAIPSKSEIHRYIISSLLSRSKTNIDNIVYSKDVIATINCAEALGAKIEKYDNSIFIDSTNFLNVNETLDCNESGSTLRFFIPICLLDGKEYILTGSKRLFERNLDEYINICKENDFLFDINDNVLKVKGKLENKKYILSSKISSQFATGLIFALSYLSGESQIEFIDEVNSKNYIDMTISILNEFNIDVKFIDDKIIKIIGNTFISKNCKASGDYSNSAFFDALNYLGGDIKINGLNSKSFQPDKKYIEYFDELNKGYSEISVSQCPDLFPILSVMAVLKNGAKFLNTNRLKLKESDRAMAMKNELSKFGASIEIHNNYVIVNKAVLHRPNENILSHNDHRIVMSMAIMLTQFGGTIEGIEAVEKSYPNFFIDLQKVLV